MTLEPGPAPREYLTEPDRHRAMTLEEAGVLALLAGLEAYTIGCADRYADPCAAIEMGLPQIFRGARSMLNYAPETLRRGAIDSRLAELLRAWKVDPDTLEWIGDDPEPDDERTECADCGRDLMPDPDNDAGTGTGWRHVHVDVDVDAPTAEGLDMTHGAHPKPDDRRNPDVDAINDERAEHAREMNLDR